MSLFRYSHPQEYEYFRKAIISDLNAGKHEGADEASLIRALAQLPEASVTRVCPCGESTCSTFSFAEGACACILLSMPSETVVIEFDEAGNLTGVEKISGRTQNGSAQKWRGAGVSADPSRPLTY
jgi:hypothetical protein